jgi:hypothetical protein
MTLKQFFLKKPKGHFEDFYEKTKNIDEFDISPTVKLAKYRRRGKKDGRNTVYREEEVGSETF